MVLCVGSALNFYLMLEAPANTKDQALAKMPSSMKQALAEQGGYAFILQPRAIYGGSTVSECV